MDHQRGHALPPQAEQEVLHALPGVGLVLPPRPAQRAEIVEHEQLGIAERGLDRGLALLGDQVRQAIIMQVSRDQPQIALRRLRRARLHQCCDPLLQCTPGHLAVDKEGWACLGRGPAEDSAASRHRVHDAERGMRLAYTSRREEHAQPLCRDDRVEQHLARGQLEAEEVAHLQHVEDRR
jgi:hypothetical protein